MLFFRQALLAQRGSDGDKLTPSHVSSSRGPSVLDTRQSLNVSQMVHDDDDKLLDVVGPPQSPLLSLGHTLQQMHPHPHAGRSLFHFFRALLKGD